MAGTCTPNFPFQGASSVLPRAGFSHSSSRFRISVQLTGLKPRHDPNEDARYRPRPCYLPEGQRDRQTAPTADVKSARPRATARGTASPTRPRSRQLRTTPSRAARETSGASHRQPLRVAVGLAVAVVTGAHAGPSGLAFNQIDNRDGGADVKSARDRHSCRSHQKRTSTKKWSRARAATDGPPSIRAHRPTQGQPRTQARRLSACGVARRGDGQ